MFVWDMCYNPKFLMFVPFGNCFFTSLVTVHVHVWHTMYNVFHLMLTIDISLLWLFKQSPLNMHNTASPSRNKEDTS